MGRGEPAFVLKKAAGQGACIFHRKTCFTVMDLWTVLWMQRLMWKGWGSENVLSSSR